ncbi:hypothetical protein [Mesorhizobium sp. CN2-181]|uniref:hypothetical protein n=1 Tax=Mesorhizobium yinganensis TaxID=3157707 RepID=UPI0032B73B8A
MVTVEGCTVSIEALARLGFSRHPKPSGNEISLTRRVGSLEQDITLLKQELLSSLARARNEIQGLRRHIEYLRPRSEAYGVIAKMACLVDGPSHPMTEDLVWEFDRKISELETTAVKAEIDRNFTGAATVMAGTDQQRTPL